MATIPKNCLFVTCNFDNVYYPSLRDVIHECPTECFRASHSVPDKSSGIREQVQDPGTGRTEDLGEYPYNFF